MRFMLIVKASKDSEMGKMPSEKLMSDMMKFNEEMAKAGILLAADGLQPSSKGVRIKFSGPNRTVSMGPFSETEELIAGYWLIQAKSLDEAIEWAKRSPNPMPGDSVIEVRQIFEASDFGPTMTPELKEKEERLRSELAKSK